jgi:RNA polymerase sigma-70 factor (ECF subfamily)
MLTHSDKIERLLTERMPLTAFIACVTRNYHLAEDVYQEICVKAINSEISFESDAHLVNWFRLSARNRAIDLIRAREGRYEGLSEAALAAIEQDWDSVAIQQSEERKLALVKCLQKLTPRSREIIKLRYFEHRSGREIAEFIGGKTASAYQAIARIHKTLGECVRQQLNMANQ